MRSALFVCGVICATLSFDLVIAKRICSQCTNDEALPDVEVFFQGDACDCPKNLPYDVVEPKPPRKNKPCDLGYDIEVPDIRTQYQPPKKHTFRVVEPKIADPKTLNTHNYKLEVPEVPYEYYSNRKHDVRIEVPKPDDCPDKLQGLRTHIDRAVYQKPDCERYCRDVQQQLMQKKFRDIVAKRRRREAPIFRDDMEDGLMKESGHNLQRENYRRMRRQKDTDVGSFRAVSNCREAEGCAYSFETCQKCGGSKGDEKTCNTCYKCFCEPMPTFHGNDQQDDIVRMSVLNTNSATNGDSVNQQELPKEVDSFVGLPHDYHYSELKNILDSYPDFVSKYGSDVLSHTPEEQRRLIKNLIIELYNEKMQAATEAPSASPSNIISNVDGARPKMRPIEANTEAVRPRYRLLDDAINAMRKIQSNTIMPPIRFPTRGKLRQANDSDKLKRKRADLHGDGDHTAGDIHKLLLTKNYDIFKLNPILSKRNSKPIDDGRV